MRRTIDERTEQRFSWNLIGKDARTVWPVAVYQKNKLSAKYFTNKSQNGYIECEGRS